MPKLTLMPPKIPAPTVVKAGKLTRYEPTAQTARPSKKAPEKPKKELQASGQTRSDSGPRSQQSQSETESEGGGKGGKLSSLIVRGDQVAFMLESLGASDAEGMVRAAALFQGNPRKSVGGVASRREGGTGYGARNSSGPRSRPAGKNPEPAAETREKPLALPGGKEKPLALPGGKEKPLALPGGKEKPLALPGGKKMGISAESGMVSAGMGFAIPEEAGKIGEKAAGAALKRGAKQLVEEATAGKTAFQSSTAQGQASLMVENLIKDRAGKIREAMKAKRPDLVAREVAGLYAPGLEVGGQVVDIAKRVLAAVKKKS